MTDTPEQTDKNAIRKWLIPTPEKRIIVSGVDCGSGANGSHVARQVSVAREPWEGLE